MPVSTWWKIVVLSWFVSHDFKNPKISKIGSILKKFSHTQKTFYCSFLLRTPKKLPLRAPCYYVQKTNITPLKIFAKHGSKKNFLFPQKLNLTKKKTKFECIKIRFPFHRAFYSVWFLDCCFFPVTFTAKKNDLIGKKESCYQLCFCFLY